jgi:hypothetical protein
VDIFDGSSGRWSTAALLAAQSGLVATSLPMQGLALIAGRSVDRLQDDVNIYDGNTRRWSYGKLSVSRDFGFVATSLPNQGLAFFAGGVNRGL